MRTHYDNLQVSRNASDIVIRASYKALLQKYHPDKFEDRSRAERISLILNAAYAVLGDPVRRAEYDATLEEEIQEPDSPPQHASSLGADSPRHAIGSSCHGLVALVDTCHTNCDLRCIPVLRQKLADQRNHFRRVCYWHCHFDSRHRRRNTLGYPQGKANASENKFRCLWHGHLWIARSSWATV